MPLLTKERRRNWAWTEEVAKILVQPEKAIVSGFKGKIDFYYWLGQPVARVWPRSPGHNRSPAIQAQWTVFIEASQLWNQMSPIVQAAYNELASGTARSGRDLSIKGYISGLYRFPKSV